MNWIFVSFSEITIFHRFCLPKEGVKSISSVHVSALVLRGRWFFICIIKTALRWHHDDDGRLCDWIGRRQAGRKESRSCSVPCPPWLAKKNFSISKLQSNILTLTDWPPFVNVGTPRRDMREAIRPGQAAPECVCPFPSSGGFLLLLLLLLSKHHCGTNRIPQSIHWRTLLCSIETCVTEGSGFRLRPSCYTSIIIPLWDWLTDEMDDERI